MQKIIASYAEHHRLSAPLQPWVTPSLIGVIVGIAIGDAGNKPDEAKQFKKVSDDALGKDDGVCGASVFRSTSGSRFPRSPCRGATSLNVG